MDKEITVLLLAENFFPLSTASAQRMFAYARTLALHHHRTFIITKSSAHATTKLKNSTLISLETRKEIPIFDPILLFLYFIYSIKVIRSHSIDLVVSTVPKINNAIAGFLIAKLFRTPHIIDVRDFWESSLFSYPLARIIPQSLASFIVRIFSILYREASALITVNHTLKNILTNRGVPQNKVYLIPNGADTSTFRPCVDEKRIMQLRRKYGLPPSKLLFVYGGSLTLDYRFDILLRAIKNVENKDFMFLLVGKPTLLRTKKYILQIIEKLHLEKKVKVMDPLPIANMAEVLRCCDVGVIPLDDKQLLRHVITAKVFAYLASGLPVLASGPKNGELGIFIKKHRVGVFVERVSPPHFAQGFHRFLQRKSEIKRMGHRGQRMIVKYYDRNSLSLKILEIISRIEKCARKT